MKLYPKLIFWFLLANLVAVLVTVIVGPRLWTRSYSDDDAIRDGQAAVQVFESQGAEALERWLRLRHSAGVFGMLEDEQGRPLAHGLPPILESRGFILHQRVPPPRAPGDEPPPGESAMPEAGVPPGEGPMTLRFHEELPPPSVLQEALRFLSGDHDLMFDLRRGEHVRSAEIVSAGGRKYRWTATSGHPRGPRAHLYDALLHTSVGLLAIAAVALFAARRITQPITGLRRATLDLAAGRLDARVPAAVTRRRDELGELGRSFDEMAGRLQRLLESQRQLLRDVSHELRSPLARLRIASELARGTPQPGHFDRIEQEAGRLEDLIAQVLLIARLDSPVDARVREPVDITELAQQVCDDAQLEAGPRRVTIAADLRDGCTVSGRPDLLQSAIENVVRNAVRYTAEGSAVTVTAHCGEREWTIVVADHGPGVPPDQLAAIFKPFHRVSSARERETGNAGGGYGLGLAIAERAVSAHGGSISAQNAPGGGLSVEIKLPLDSAAQTSSAH